MEGKLERKEGLVLLGDTKVPSNVEYSNALRAT